MCSAVVDVAIDPQTMLKSDRERAGLRGPVKTCVEEYQGCSYSVTSEYTIDGKLLTCRTVQSDGSEWISTHIHDANGRLSKIVSAKTGQPELESLYTYDESGRPLSITNNPQRGCRIDFQYNSEGRKTAIQTFTPEALQRFKGGVSVSGSFWNAAVGSGVGVPERGKIMTTYDESGLPTESQILNEGGQVVRRFIRTNDAEGRIIEEKWIGENPSLNFLDGIPTEQRAQLSPEHVQQANETLANIFCRTAEEGMSYTYDTHGRLATTLLRFQVLDMTTEISYNEHGDEARKQRKLTLSSTRLSELFSRIENSGLGSPSATVESPQQTSPTQVCVSLVSRITRINTTAMGTGHKNR